MIKKKEELSRFLFILPLLFTLLILIARPASGATTYSVTLVPSIATGTGMPIDVGSLIITLSPGAASSSVNKSVYFALPSNPPGYTLTMGTPNISNSSGSVSITNNNGNSYTSQLKVTSTLTPTDPASDVTITIPLTITVPGDVCGDIKLDISASDGSVFSCGTITVARAGTLQVTVNIDNIKAFNNSSIELGNIYVHENTAGALISSPESLRFKLPTGFTWDLSGISTNLIWGDLGVVPTLGHFKLADNNTILFVSIQHQSNQPTRFSINGLRMNADLNRLRGPGPVICQVNGLSNVTPTSLTVAKYFPIVSTDPPDGATGVSISKNITVSFGENIQTGDNIGGVTLTKDGNQVQFTYGINGNTLALYPNGLDYSVTYAVYIPIGAIKDYGGIALTNNYSFSFTTRPYPSSGSGSGSSSGSSSSNSTTSQQATVTAVTPIPQQITPLMTTTNDIATLSPQITANGQPVIFDVAPEIKNDRTFAPVRTLAYSLGITENNVSWDNTTSTVTIISNDLTLKFTVGSNLFIINGTAQEMDMSPYIKNDRTMVPLRFFAEALGLTVEWDKKTQQVNIK
ncbi:MAG: hypothetical protein A4E53_03657 [Pelotomaculum sp. PtaB.Bin104]|nr:MAG: hypothetical protein A4E53_03657 [Pelotomaculum sp. PtaB.Bin104]